MASYEGANFLRVASSRSRMTRAFETFRSRDSASMSARSHSGNLTFSFFIERVIKLVQAPRTRTHSRRRT